MKLSRKLIPAMIMLLVSAVLMSTASFAWFSANSTAAAKNMKVSVSAARNISIAAVTYTEGEDDEIVEEIGSFASSQDLNATVESMVPGSAIAAVNPSFYYVSNAEGIDTGNYEGTVGKTSFAKASDAGLASNNNVVFVKKTVALMASGAYTSGTNHGNIQASITVTGGNTSPVTKSLRVMLVVTQKTASAEGATPAAPAAYIYAPVQGADTTYQAIVGEGLYAKEGDNKNVSGDVALTQPTDSIITGIQSDDVYVVDIYYWFEGQDENCTAANAINIALISIDVNFSFATQTGGGGQ